MDAEKTDHRQPDRTRGSWVDAADKRRAAVRFRVQGKTYRQIAEALDVSISSAHAYIKQEMDELREATRADAELLRDIEIAKLDSIEDRCRSKLRRADEQDTAKLAAVIVKITESRRKLLGLDAPQKVEMSGNLYTVKEASPDCEAWGKPAAKGEQKEGEQACGAADAASDAT